MAPSLSHILRAHKNGRSYALLHILTAVMGNLHSKMYAHEYAWPDPSGWAKREEELRVRTLPRVQTRLGWVLAICDFIMQLWLIYMVFGLQSKQWHSYIRAQ